MKRTMVFLLLVVLPGSVWADSYLCVVDAAAVVEDTKEGGRITARLAKIERDKYVLTNTTGQWQVKILGAETAWLDKCVSPYLCEHSSGYAGTFMRDDNGIFTVVFVTNTGDRNQLVAAKGRCSRI
jgi:hypothetical protein